MVLVVPLGAKGSGTERLSRAGLLPVIEGGEVRLDEPLPTAPLFRHMRDYDFYGDKPVRVVALQAPVAQPPKELFWIPALLLLGLVLWVQHRRAKAAGDGKAASPTPASPREPARPGSR